MSRAAAALDRLPRRERREVMDAANRQMDAMLAEALERQTHDAVEARLRALFGPSS